MLGPTPPASTMVGQAAAGWARTLLEASVYPTVSPPSRYADIAAQDISQNSGYSNSPTW